MNALQPRFYFSFRSPYAWIAARKVEERFPFDRFTLDYMPYWEPDARTLAVLQDRGAEVLYRPMSRPRQLYILQDVKRIVTRLGYAWRWPVDGPQPWWELPHLAYLYARRHGKAKAFFDAVCRARWEQGLDVTQPAVIAAIAERVEIDPAAALASVDDEGLIHEGADLLWRAWRDGVFGVPFFIVGHEKFWGQDRFDEFLEGLEQHSVTFHTRRSPCVLRQSS
jgi:2-hydroxychromene-2-carboxylate isomerase